MSRKGSYEQEEIGIEFTEIPVVPPQLGGISRSSSLHRPLSIEKRLSSPIQGYFSHPMTLLHKIFNYSTCLIICFLPFAHSARFEFSLLAHLLQRLLASKINSHISTNFCQNLHDGRWILKALTANQ